MSTSRPSDPYEIVVTQRVPSLRVAPLVDVFLRSHMFDRLRAAIFLKDLGPVAAPTVPVMIEALNDVDERIRSSAAMVLGSVGEAAIPAAAALVRSLSDPGIGVADGAQRALQKLGAAAMTPEAIAALEAMAPYDRKLAVERFGPLAAGVNVTQSDLLQALSAWEIDKPFDEQGRFAWDELVDVVERHRNPKLRNKAVAALGAMGERARGAAGFLLKLSERPIGSTEDIFLIQATMHALSKVDLPTAIPELLRLAQAEGEFWTTALDALAARGIAAAPAGPELRKWMQERESVDSKVYLAVTLWKIGDRDAEVASAISAFLGQRHAFFLSTPRVMGFLRRCQVHEFIPELIQSLTHSQCGEFVGMAAETLGEFGEAARGAIPSLEQLATGGSHYARLCAAVALHRIDPSSSIAVPALVEMVAGPRKVIESYDDEGLLRLMMRTTEPRDRARAAAALGELGPAAQSALPALRLAAGHEDEKLRTAALAAIENIERA